MTRVKICGLTRTEDVAVAIEAGADMLGFIHVAGTPRFVDVAALKELLGFVAGRAQTVVVVRNAPPEQLSVLRAELDFDLFQFHGDESPQTVAAHKGYKVIHIKDRAPDPSSIQAYGEPFLLDTQVGNMQGGTGKAFDWEIIPRLSGRFLVAGGLNPDNVASLTSRYHPWGVDVSSGVEVGPGIKDHEKLKAFINRVQEA